MIWNDGFILSINGTCTDSWDQSEYVAINLITPPIQNIYTSLFWKSNPCDSDCFSWDGTDNSEHQWIPWVLNKYKSNKTDSSEFTIYVSNLIQDIDRDYELQTGELDTPFVDLMMAFDQAFGKMIPYYLDANGDLITVRISLFKGDHFILKQKNHYQWLNQNWYKNFKVVIR